MLARLESDVYLNILIEFAEDRNHPVEREAAKMCVTDVREFEIPTGGQPFFPIAYLTLFKM